MNVVAKLLGTMMVLNVKRDERGATATEYALLVGAIAAMLVLAGVAFADELQTKLEAIFP